MLEVDADARPGRRTAAHGVDQHVAWLEVRGDVGVTSLPALQAGQRLVLAGRARDLDQRSLRHAAAGGSRCPLAPPRRLHARWLAGLLSVLRRPRRIALPLSLVALRELEQALERARTIVDRG